MDKVQGLEQWDLSEIAADKQLATVSVFVAYPKISPQLIALAPVERRQFIAQKMRESINKVLKINKLIKCKLLKAGGSGSRFYGVSGELKVSAIPELAQLAVVESVRIDVTNGIKKRLFPPRKRLTFYCVKMTVAIKIEGRDKGMQGYEERYVLYKGHSAAEAIQKAEVDALAYQEPYLNSDGQLVRWKVERIDDAYEVVTQPGAKDLEGAEVFSVLKTRKLRPDCIWTGPEHP